MVGIYVDPAIALQRIEEYDGQYVTFRYHDKKDGKEKWEKLTVEEFIARLIVHIPDEQFKTIRYYGVYSRRIKAICKKVITAWQKVARKWIVKIKRTISRRKWDQRIKEQTGKDPLLCPHCGNYYEYKGEVCLKEGQLGVKHAVSQMARDCLERMIYNFTGIKTAEAQQKEEKAPKQQEFRRVPEYSQLYLFGV